MGLSSNQARFLSLTARQVDMEQRIQQICQRRLRLSSELENVANAYNRGISNRKMSLANRTNQGIQTLSIANLEALGYKVIGLNTDKVVQRPAINPVGKTVIDSQEQFLQIVQNLNAGNNLGDSYVLNCDIDLSSLGTLNSSLITQNFTGIFDGNGHTISNLNINASSGNGIGLFSSSSGTIKNIALENVNINASSSNSIGCITGFNSGTVSNAYASGSINGQGGLGGLVGQNYNGLIENSTADVDVIGTTGAVGGLVGGNNQSTINNSTSFGDVTCNSTGANGYDVGGFVGINLNDSYIDNCYSTGNVYSATSSKLTVGGFAGSSYNQAGYTTGVISNSYSTGSVASDYYIGGFVGSAWNGTVVENCYTTSNLSATGGNYGFSGNVYNGSVIDNSNFYANNSHTNGTGVAAVDASSSSPDISTWSDAIWDKSTTLPTLKNTGYTAYADDLETGLRNGTYSLAREADEFTQDPFQINGKSYEEIDWRTTPEIYDELNRGDDVDAENKYDKIISEINAQDKKLQLEQTSVEVEYKAVTSEKEAVKKILDTNAQSSFKYFS